MMVARRFSVSDFDSNADRFEAYEQLCDDLEEQLEAAKQRELELLAVIEQQRDYIRDSLPHCGRCDKEAVGTYYYHDEDGEEWCCEECHKAGKNFFAHGGKLDEFVVYGTELISENTPPQALREHEAEILEWAAGELAGERDCNCVMELDHMAEERRKK